MKFFMSKSQYPDRSCSLDFLWLLYLVHILILFSQKVEQTGITVCNLASELLQKVGQAGITVPAKLPIVGRAK